VVSRVVIMEKILINIIEKNLHENTVKTII
jgi:hypothetical protein